MYIVLFFVVICFPYFYLPKTSENTSNMPPKHPQNTSTWFQKTPFQPPTPAAQARRMGRNLFNIHIYIYNIYIHIYIYIYIYKDIPI